MKKTVTINLGGIVFHIDEDACNKLELYLKQIQSGITDESERKEIMSDIEVRLAEICRERMGNTRQVVTIEDIHYAISIMGTPEDINNEQPGKEETQQNTTFSRGKRLYRDPDHRVLGGVGSGIGAYFGIDPVIIRILLVLTFFAFGPLLYIVLWIAMPEAKTTAQKLEMRGEAVNVENISKNIKDEYTKVKSSISKNSTWDEIANVFKQIFTVAFHILGVIFKVAFSILGVIIIIAGLFLLLGFTDVFVFGGWQTGLSGITDFISMFMNPDLINLLIIGLFLIVGIPIVMILLFIIRKLAGLNKPIKLVSSVLSIAWFAGIAIIIYLAISQSRNYKSWGTSTEITQLDSLGTKTLVLNGNQVKYPEDNVVCCDDHLRWIVRNDEDFRGIFVVPEISVIYTEDSISYIKTEKLARGKNKTTASKNAIFPYPVSLSTDSVLQINPGLLIEKGNRFYFNRIKVKIFLSEGQSIYFSPECSDYITNADNIEDLYEYEMAGKTWVMTKDGLKQIK
ncbi:MAG: hypothetical protein CVU05_04970 [Bacteroidetes bacterium HGW-Bacteroidetes-21]|jgi:phage shock protein PspC (stress-responsive transcriptional regulator)|nr:MAG: hypothetical protein CVU05_04970 [Bacteroidetes bacterium HGW-Bacteroidetes-21]